MLSAADNHTLWAIVDKLRTNTMLEVPVQTLFRTQFVEFEQVKTTTAGVPLHGTNAETATLSSEITTAFSRQVVLLTKPIIHNGMESCTLAQWRDTLLPCLISDRLREMEAHA